jgi:hypothetical protein
MFQNQKIKIIVFSITLMILVGVANSAKAQPAAISDLICSSNLQTSGAIDLVWTVPTGAVAYEAKYVQGNSIDYNSAATYSQSWSAGTAGQKKSETIFNLNPDTEFTIAIKSKDILNDWSVVSNPVSCKGSVALLFDNQAPSSKIITPENNSTFSQPKEIIIKGQSSDIGGSSVQKVEISLDDGKTWFLTKPKEKVGTGFNWEYLWEKPIVASYTIKTRATDWWGNQELPGAGIKIVISSELPIEKPPIEKPISQMSVIELEAKIAEIQQQIIQLLAQLIQLTQSQLSQIKNSFQ